MTNGGVQLQQFRSRMGIFSQFVTPVIVLILLGGISTAR